MHFWHSSNAFVAQKQCLCATGVLSLRGRSNASQAQRQCLATETLPLCRKGIDSVPQKQLLRGAETLFEWLSGYEEGFRMITDLCENSSFKKQTKITLHQKPNNRKTKKPKNLGTSALREKPKNQKTTKPKKDIGN